MAIYFDTRVLKVDIPLSTSQINLYHFEAGSDMPDVCKADTSKRTSPPQSHRKSTDICQNHIAYSLTTFKGKRLKHVTIWSVIIRSISLGMTKFLGKCIVRMCIAGALISR